MKNYLTYKPSIGCTIHQELGKCLKLAEKYNRPVRMKFNGHRFRVTKRLSMDHLVNLYWHQSSASNLRYRMSPESIAYEIKRKADIIAAQKRIDDLMDVLPFISIENVDVLMMWIKDFVKDADDIAIRFDYDKIIRGLESMGYVEDFGVGESKEFFNMTRNMAGWIVGQAISMLKGGMPPHPMLKKFVDDYFKIVAVEKENEARAWGELV